MNTVFIGVLVDGHIEEYMANLRTVVLHRQASSKHLWVSPYCSIDGDGDGTCRVSDER
jgi:hypothetical protein